MSGHTYRPEIDGLRAVAVAAVVLFHLEISGFGGGFVGVDIFFVISGYLITGFIRREISAGCFHFRRFFLRRLRRLAPALLLVVIVACAVAWFALLPEQLHSFAASVLAQPIALQNMYFLSEGQYFVGAEGKPLLHTWSLGVEEQFYLVWPFILVLLSRYGRRRLVLGVISIIAASFALNLALPKVSPKAAFFLFPARAWELGAGGLLAVMEEHQRRWHASVRNAVSWASAIALVASIALIDRTMPFPGWAALLPVLGTTGLIAAATQGKGWVERFLSLPSLVRVGLLSYAIYLWHWPIIVFFRHLGYEPSGPTVALSVLCLTGLAAGLSFRFIEEPIRRRRALRRDGRLVGATLAASAILVGFGSTAMKTDGFAFRYQEPARSMLTAPLAAEGDARCGFFFRALHPSEVACQVNSGHGRDGVLLWGNSHAAMWVGLFAELGEAARRPVFLTARNCRPTADNSFCDDDLQTRILDFARRYHIRDVVFMSTWYGAYGIEDSVFERQLRRVVDRVAGEGMRLWLVVDVPTGEALDPAARYREHPERPSFGAVPRGDRPRRERELLRRLAEPHQDVRVIDPTDAFCSADLCWGGQDGLAWYRDEEHLTSSGARRARQYFDVIFAP